MKHASPFSSAALQISHLLGLSTLLALSGCGDFQKDIVVPLPNYQSELVVECYLEPGVVPRLLVTESVPYISPQLASVPAGVTVELTMPDGQRVPLTAVSTGNLPGSIDLLTKQVYTHIGQTPLVANPGDTFGLDIRDGQGRHITGTATVPTVIPLDSVTFKFNDLTGDNHKAYIIGYFKDPDTPNDCYRFQIHKSDSIYNNPDTDRLLEDKLNNGGIFPMGTGYRYVPGDTITTTLYHTDEAYYRFRSSTRDARNANGNPFAQPSAIASTVQGGIGVFTVLSSSQQRMVLPK
jgi:hypothetical protein